MCAPALIPLAAAVIGAGSAAHTARSARKDAQAQRGAMERAEADRVAAQDRAAQDAQMRVAERRRRMRGQALLTVAGGGVDSASALSRGGKTTLGG